MPKQTFLNLDAVKRDAIIKASFEEFSCHTYNEASVNVIVENSGISKGSLYQYFNDKKDLYLYMIEYAGQVKLEFLQKQSIDNGDDFFDRLCALMILSAKFSLANPLYSKLLYKALQGSLIDESLARLKELNYEFLSSLIKSAIEKGEIRKDADIDIIVFYLSVLTTEFAQFVTDKTGVSWFKDSYDKEVLMQYLPDKIKELMKLIKNGLAPIKI